MPNRIIRESMLDSTRYLSVSVDARLLYTHLLLLADDFGCLSIEHAFIGRRCFDSRPTADQLDELIAQLAGADLIRLYDHRHLHFAFIPRFRQRLKRETLKNPQPPDELLVDDADAQEKFRRLNGHDFKGTASARSPPETRPPAARQTPEESNPAAVEKSGNPKEVKDLEVEQLKEVKAAPAGDSRNPVDMAAQLAEKMRLKESSKSESEKP